MEDCSKIKGILWGIKKKSVNSVATQSYDILITRNSSKRILLGIKKKSIVNVDIQSCEICIWCTINDF